MTYDPNYTPDGPVGQALIHDVKLDIPTTELIQQHRSRWNALILEMTGTQIKASRVSIEEELKRIEEYKQRVIALKDQFRASLS